MAADNLTDLDFERLQATDVRDVQVKQCLEREHLADVARRHVIFFEDLLKDETDVLEDALRDLNAILLLEELQHLLAVKLLGLCTSNEVTLSGNLAAV